MRNSLLFLCCVLLSYTVCAAGPSSSLFSAVSTGDLTALQKQLEVKPDLDIYSSDGLTPLILASRNGNMEIVSMLITAGADVNFPAKDLTSPLIAAAVNGHDEIAQLLLSKGADISQTDANNMNAYDHVVEAKPQGAEQAARFDRLFKRLHAAMTLYAESNR